VRGLLSVHIRLHPCLQPLVWAELDGFNAVVWLALLAFVAAAYTQAQARILSCCNIHAHVRTLALSLSRSHCLSNNAKTEMLGSIATLLLLYCQKNHYIFRTRKLSSAVHAEHNELIGQAKRAGNRQCSYQHQDDDAFGCAAAESPPPPRATRVGLLTIRIAIFDRNRLILIKCSSLNMDNYYSYTTLGARRRGASRRRCRASSGQVPRRRGNRVHKTIFSEIWGFL